jgi:hypothetical protein
MQLDLGSEGDAGYQQLEGDRRTTVVDLKTVAVRRAAMKTAAAKPLPMRRAAMKTTVAKPLSIRRAAMKTGAARAKTTPRKTLVVTTTALRPMDKGKGKFQQGDKQ